MSVLTKHLNMTSHMSLLLKQSQRQRSFLGFAQKMFNNNNRG